MRIEDYGLERGGSHGPLKDAVEDAFARAEQGMQVGFPKATVDAGQLLRLLVENDYRRKQLTEMLRLRQEYERR
jgi:hypothetical protein